MPVQMSLLRMMKVASWNFTLAFLFICSHSERVHASSTLGLSLNSLFACKCYQWFEGVYYPLKLLSLSLFSCSSQNNRCGPFSKCSNSPHSQWQGTQSKRKRRKKRKRTLRQQISWHSWCTSSRTREKSGGENCKRNSRRRSRGKLVPPWERILILLRSLVDGRKENRAREKRRDKCKRKEKHKQPFLRSTHPNITLYYCVYVCMCVCVCLCLWFHRRRIELDINRLYAFFFSRIGIISRGKSMNLLSFTVRPAKDSQVDWDQGGQREIKEVSKRSEITHEEEEDSAHWSQCSNRHWFLFSSSHLISLSSRPSLSLLSLLSLRPLLLSSSHHLHSSLLLRQCKLIL